MRIDACPEPSQNRGNELMHRMGVAVWGVGFRCVLARTPPEHEQKHRFLQCPRAFWRALVGKVNSYSFQERFGVPLWGK